MLEIYSEFLYTKYKTRPGPISDCSIRVKYDHMIYSKISKPIDCSIRA